MDCDGQDATGMAATELAMKKDTMRDPEAAPSRRARAVIVEDEREALVSLRESLARVSWIEIVAEAKDGRKAIEVIDRLRPDLVFLDVQLPELSGLEVLKHIAHTPEVIFTTAYDQHALTAFELGALDYLVKPFGSERLLRTLDRARRYLVAGSVAEPSPDTAAAGTSVRGSTSRHRVPPSGSSSEGASSRGGLSSTERPPSPRSSQPSETPSDGAEPPPESLSSTERVRAVFGAAPLERLFARKHDRIFPIAVRDIQRIQALGDYAEVHAATGVFLLHVSLTELEARLDPNRFLRVHRSHIVSLDAIRHLQSYDERRLLVVLADGSEVIASRKASEKIRGLAR